MSWTTRFRDCVASFATRRAASPDITISRPAPECWSNLRHSRTVAKIPRRISPHSLRHAAITNALDAGVPLRDAQILARHADPRTTEHYDRARGNLDRHGVHFLTAYVAGV
ncbi:tyrosine-type recombinase/integrase [Aeromicrobium yanjiei]|uniref:Tyrosine-type recombinase/integrase n=1 Tax=Aeromicrobium yanjiei TaxID=2662028 RepID=A0A5Q2MEI9_9ACTN|nr:tyrosine-type recombinase/integrase [Aeromicrobium yanjiei]